MISQQTIDEVRSLQRRYMAEALEHVSEAGHVVGDKCVYGRLIAEARKYKECAEDLERMRNVSA